MPVVIVEYIDLFDGATASLHIVNGQTIRVKAVLDYVESDDTGTLFQQAQNAILASRPLGSACLNVDEPTFFESMTNDAIGPDQVTVFLNYRGFPTLQVDIDCCLATVDSNTDAKGNLITTKYTYPKNYPYGDPRVRGQTITQGGTYPKQITEITFALKFTVTRVGSTNASTIVLNFAQTYVGMINQTVWGSAPGPARCWLCETVRATSRDGTRTYEMTVTFHFRKGNNPDGSGGWDFLVLFIDPNTGKPPPDLIAGIGAKNIIGYTAGVLPQMPPPGISIP